MRQFKREDNFDQFDKRITFDIDIFSDFLNLNYINYSIFHKKLILD